MSEQNANTDPSLKDQLVSYLDGELDAQTSRQIERQLAEDATLREKMQQLDRTWELLGTLDTSPCAETFTHTTLEMVSTAAAEDLESSLAAAPRRRRRRLALVVAGLLVAGMAGFLGVIFWAPNPNHQLIHDLPVLENLDKYRWVDDVQFIQMLLEEDLFAEEGETEGADEQ